jgi:hypothetical protein
MAREGYYDRGHHEAASKFLGQEAVSAKYYAILFDQVVLDFLQPIRSDRRKRL